MATKSKASPGIEPEVLYDGTSGDPTSVWFDPGGVTGWAVFSVHPDALIEPDVKILDNITHWSCGQFTGTEFDLVDQMVELAASWPGAALGCEDFILRRFDQNRAVLSPVRINAAFRYTVGRQRAVYMQQPQLAMTTITDDRMKALGYWEQTSGLVHARDAIRHNLTFLKRLKTQADLLRKVFPALLSA